MTDDIDDIFKTFDKFFNRMIKESGFGNAGIFPWSNTNSYQKHREVVRSTSPPREEIFRYDDNITVVMELGYKYNEDNIAIDIIEKDGKRILQVKSVDKKITRRYALASDMTGEFDWAVTNGILEIVLQKTVEVVDLEGEDGSKGTD